MLQVVRLKTLLGKIIGTILSVSANMAMGPEGNVLQRKKEREHNQVGDTFFFSSNFSILFMFLKKHSTHYPSRCHHWCRLTSGIISLLLL